MALLPGGVHEDVEGVGGPHRSHSVGQTHSQVLLSLRHRSRRDVLDVSDGLGTGQTDLLGEHFCLFLGELVGELLLEVLDVEVVAVVAGLPGQEGGDVEETGVGPAVHHALADVHVLALLELLLLGQLHSRVQHEEERAEAGFRVGLRVVVAVL